MPNESSRISLVDSALPTRPTEMAAPGRRDLQAALDGFKCRAVSLFALAPETFYFLIDRGQRRLLKEITDALDLLTEVDDLLVDLLRPSVDSPDVSDLQVLAPLAIVDEGDPVFRSVQEGLDSLQEDFRAHLLDGRPARTSESSTVALFDKTKEFETKLAKVRELATDLSGAKTDFESVDWALAAQNDLQTQLPTTLSSIQSDIDAGDMDSALYRLTAHKALFSRTDKDTKRAMSDDRNEDAVVPVAQPPVLPPEALSSYLPRLTSGSLKYKVDGGAEVTKVLDPTAPRWAARHRSGSKRDDLQIDADNKYIYFTLDYFGPAPTDYKVDVLGGDAAPLTMEQVKDNFNADATAQGIFVRAYLEADNRLLLSVIEDPGAAQQIQNLQVYISDLTIKVGALVDDQGDVVQDPEDADDNEPFETKSAHEALGLVVDVKSRGAELLAAEAAEITGLEVQETVKYEGSCLMTVDGGLFFTEVIDDDGQLHAAVGDVLTTDFSEPMKVLAVNGSTLQVGLIGHHYGEVGAKMPDVMPDDGQYHGSYTVSTRQLLLKSSSDQPAAAVEVTQDPSMGFTVAKSVGTSRTWKLPGVVGLQVGDQVLGGVVEDVSGEVVVLDTDVATDSASASVVLPEVANHTTVEGEWTALLDGTDDTSPFRTEGETPNAREVASWETVSASLRSALEGVSSLVASRRSDLADALVQEAKEKEMHNAVSALTEGRFSEFYAMKAEDADAVLSVEAALNDILTDETVHESWASELRG